MGWFRRGQGGSGPDYSAVASRDETIRLADEGELVPMLLLPEMFGGDASDPNIVFVPPFAAALKTNADDNIIAPLAAKGAVTRYDAKPSYAGGSFVPIKVTVRAHDPGEFSQTIQIWIAG